MKGLTKAIHARWAANAALVAALATDRLTTGIRDTASPALPYCVLTKASSGDRNPANDGRYTRVWTARFSLYHEVYDSAETIADLIAAAFDEATFTVDTADTCLSMRQADWSEELQENGAWKFTIEFECLVEQGV